MEIERVDITPYRPISVAGNTVLPGDTATIHGARRIAQLGRPDPREIAALANYGHGNTDPSERWISNQTGWKVADQAEYEETIQKTKADYKKQAKRAEHQLKAAAQEKAAAAKAKKEADEVRAGNVADETDAPAAAPAGSNDAPPTAKA